MAGGESGGPNAGFIARAHKVFLVFGALYASFLVLACVPYMQKQLIYCHWLRIPLFPDYEHPESYGLAPFKATNIRISTPDGESLGAWFSLPDSLHRTLNATAPPSDSTIAASLHSRPTILYLHGNAATRAAHTRVEHLSSFSNRLDVNVLALDYRGFADSTGDPSQEGLTTDAVAAFDWLVERGAKEGDVLIAGTSLGTGVAVQAAAVLEGAGKKARGVVLFAPFSDVASLLDTYYIIGFVPLMKPLSVFPHFVATTFKSFLTHKFDSMAKLKDLHQPLLLVHAEDDWDIPFSHSARLFASAQPEVAEEIENAKEAAGTTSEGATRVAERSIERLGKLQTLERDQGRGPVVHLQTFYGAHERVGLQEGVQDVVRAMFDL